MSLLHLDARDVRALALMQNRSRALQYTLKRSCKYGVRRGAEFSEAKMLTFEALRNLKDAAALLLELAQSGIPKKADRRSGYDS